MFRRQHMILLATAVLLTAWLARPTQAQSSETPKLEVGGHFSLIHLLDVETPIFPPADGPILGYRRSRQTNAGFGGRVGYNLTGNVTLEGELNYFPQERNRLRGNGLQGLFGAKAGWRGERVGVFGKARPGFFRYEEPLVCVTTPCPTPKLTKFALDLGGVLEFYPSRNLVTRFDVGDTLMRDERITGAFPRAVKDVFHHNLQVSAGIGFRF
jgi:hypothetical protein